MNTSPASFSFTALALKIVGVVMILSSLLDYILMTIPFNPGVREWQIALATQFVDRGVIPLVGIVFVLLGYLLDNERAAPKSFVGDLRFWALLLSSVLG
ncbi:MAG TPA: HpsJ family protein, partial [Candidatus Sericytochromatia bacterium]